MNDNSLPPQPKDTKPLLYRSIGISFLILVISIGFYVWMFHGGLSEKSEVWGHFGDYFNLFIGFANLLIVTLLTWGIFNSQQENDKWKEYQSKENREIQKLVYLEGLVNKSIAFANKTVIGLRKFSESIEGDPEEIPILKTASSSAIDRIVRKIDQEEFFHSYLSKVGSNGSLEIFEALDVIYENYHEQLKDIEMMTQNNFVRRSDLMKLIKEIIDECANLMNHEKANGRREGEIFSFLDDVIFSYYEGVEAHPNKTFEFQQRTFAPILEFFQANDRYLNDDYKKLISLTMKANKSIAPIRDNNLSLAERSITIADSIETVVADIKTDIDALKDFNSRNES